MKLQEISLVILALFELFTFARGISLYKKTKVKDYLYFSTLWIAASITSTMQNAILIMGENEFFIKIREMGFVVFFLAIYAFSIRTLLTNEKLTYKILMALGFIYSSILVTLTVLWKNTDQRLNVPKEQNITMNIGIKIGPVLYSSQYPLARNIFGIVAFAAIAIAYFSFKPPIHDKRLITARRLWQTAAVFGNLYAILLSFWYIIGVSQSFRLIFALLAIIPITIITFRYPEGYIISFSQIYRAAKTYEKTPQMKKNDFEEDQILEYIQQAARIIRNKTKESHLRHHKK